MFEKTKSNRIFFLYESGDFVMKNSRTKLIQVSLYYVYLFKYGMLFQTHQFYNNALLDWYNEIRCIIIEKNIYSRLVR